MLFIENPDLLDLKDIVIESITKEQPPYIAEIKQSISLLCELFTTEFRRIDGEIAELRNPITTVGVPGDLRPLLAKINQLESKVIDTTHTIQEMQLWMSKHKDIVEKLYEVDQRFLNTHTHIEAMAEALDTKLDRLSERLKDQRDKDAAVITVYIIIYL